MRNRLGLGIVAWAITSASWAAGTEQQWPSWRGPAGNGIASRANPPLKWSETEHVKWKIKIPGKGTATPVVWDNQVFVLTAIPTGKKVEPAATNQGASLPFLAPQIAGIPQAQANPPAPGEAPREGQPRGRRGGFGRAEKPTEEQEFVLLSLDRGTGQTRWRQVARTEVPHEGHHRDHGFASHSPLVDGTHVYAWFGSRGLHCYDLEGRLKWSKYFGQLKTANTFGEGNAPVLHGNKLVLNWDHEGDDFIAAFDKNTGSELWRQKRDEKTTWSTPLVVEAAGKTQVIVPATRKVRSYDLANGNVLWECAGLGSNVIPTPVAGHGMVFVMSGHQNPALLAIKLGRSGELTGSDAIAWRRDRGTPYVPSPLLVGESLYYFSRNDGRLSCYNALNGEPRYEQVVIEGLNGVYASPVEANGRIYLVGRNGATVVIKSSDKVEVLASNKLDEKFDASPALAGNQLFLRGHEHLYCLAEK